MSVDNFLPWNSRKSLQNYCLGVYYTTSLAGGLSPAIQEPARITGIC